MAISIKEPCHEDWAKMTSTEKGAFCQSCAMEVIDFTNKTPFEIKSILSHEFSTSSRTCGRITNYQLDQINDDFFQWKNERESFSAVWIFSLIAVFGLTLFSCQNTASKEMIEQLNIETAALLDGKDSTEVELTAIDSLETDSLSGVGNLPIVPWNPYEIVTFQGIMPPIDFFKVNKFEICTVFLGDLTTTGLIGIAPEGYEFLANPELFPNYGQYTPPTPYNGPTATQNNAITNNTLTAGGDKKFDAFIYPNPVEVISRLYLSVHEKTDINFTIHQKGETEPMRSGNSSFVTGQHEVDLKLYKLNEGNYQLKLASNKQVSVLDFEV